MSDVLHPPRGVSLNASLPFAVYAQAHPEGWQWQQLMRSNLHLLEAINAIEKPITEKYVTDHYGDEEEWRADFVRMDRRISLLLELVGQLVARDRVLPSARSLQLSEEGLCWEAGQEELVKGEAVTLEIFHPAFPASPLRLPATYGGEMSSEGRRYARFIELDEEIAVQLNHLIFRQHRRELRSGFDR